MREKILAKVGTEPSTFVTLRLNPHFKYMNFMYSHCIRRYLSIIYGLMIDPHDDQLPVGLIALLIEHCTRIAEGLSLVQAFFSLLLKDGAYYCYCAYVLRTWRYSGFLSVMLTNTEIFLRGLKLSGETGSY